MGVTPLGNQVGGRSSAVLCRAVRRSASLVRNRGFPLDCPLPFLDYSLRRLTRQFRTLRQNPAASPCGGLFPFGRGRTTRLARKHRHEPTVRLWVNVGYCAIMSAGLQDH